MDKKDMYKKFNPIFKFIFMCSFFVAFCIVLFDAFVSLQDFDLEEKKKFSVIAFEIFQSFTGTTLCALVYLVAVVIILPFYTLFYTLIEIVNSFGLNGPIVVVVISVIFLCVALVEYLVLNAPLKKNDLPAQYGALSYRFCFTKIFFTQIVFVALFGKVVMTVKLGKIRLVLRKH